MPANERSHFSKRTLSVAERSHRNFGHSEFGRFITRLVAGSSSPAYHQLDWYTAVTADIKKSVEVPGDPTVSRLALARFWPNAMGVRVDFNELYKLVVDYPGGEEAVAYRSNGTTHAGVGVEANAIMTRGAIYSATVFGETLPEYIDVFMRRGSGPLEATLGVFIPEERAFVGVEGSLRLIEESLPVKQIAVQYPSAILP